MSVLTYTACSMMKPVDIIVEEGRRNGGLEGTRESEKIWIIQKNENDMGCT